MGRKTTRLKKYYFFKASQRAGTLKNRVRKPEKDEKSGWVLMVPLPHLNFLQFRTFSGGPFGTGSIQPVYRDLITVPLAGVRKSATWRLPKFQHLSWPNLTWLPFGFYLICFNFGDVIGKCPKEWNVCSFWHLSTSFWHLLVSFWYTWEHLESTLSIFSVCWIPFPPWLHTAKVCP